MAARPGARRCARRAARRRPPDRRLAEGSVARPRRSTRVFVEAARRTGAVLALARATQVRDQELKQPLLGRARRCWPSGSPGTEMDARLMADRSRLEKRVARHAAAGRGRAAGGPRPGRPAARRGGRWLAASSTDVDVLLTPGSGAAARCRRRAGASGAGCATSGRAAATRRSAPRGTSPAGRRWPCRPGSIRSGRPRCRSSSWPRPANEARLLAVAAQIEAAAPRGSRSRRHYA